MKYITKSPRNRWRKVYGRLQSMQRVDRIYLKVYYETIDGVDYINEYDGPSKREALQAFRAFLEKS